MHYVSTRGLAPTLDFSDVLLAGLARDGGLYLPETWPAASTGEIAALAGRTYPDAAFTIIRPYVAGSIADADLAAVALRRLEQHRLRYAGLLRVVKRPKCFQPRRLRKRHRRYRR